MNSYTMFSTAFRLRDEAEIFWFDQVAAITRNDEMKVVGAGSAAVTHKEKKLLTEARDDIGVCELLRRDDTAYLISEELGVPDYAVLVARLYLKHFNPKGVLTLEIAFQGSKPRPGEFGGAAVIITASKTKSFSTAEWLNSQLKKHNPKSVRNEC